MPQCSLLLLLCVHVYVCVYVLQSLPLQVDMTAFATGGDAAVGPVRLPEWYPDVGLSKADVHGDMGLVVIALNWPRCGVRVCLCV